MGTECQLPRSEEDRRMIDEAMNRVQDLSPETKEWFEKEIKPGLDRAEERWKVAESIGIEMENMLEPATACGDPKELIANANPDTVIISHEEKVPIFATELENTGQEVSKSIKDYPKDFPEVKVYTPVVPTVDNLRKMLGVNKSKCPLAPISPWGDPIELHHYEQDPKGPLMMVQERFHDEVPHPKEGLTREERATYNRQRQNIYRMAAEAYLGEELTEDFKNAIKSKEEKNHE